MSNLNHGKDPFLDSFKQKQFWSIFWIFLTLRANWLDFSQKFTEDWFGIYTY